MRTTTKRSAGVASVVVGLIGLSIAFAAWTSTGEGDGDVTAGEATALTVTVSDVTGLYPTQSKNLPFTVTNPNPYAVTLTGADFGGVKVDTESADAGCVASVVDGDAITLPDVVVAASGTSDELLFPVTMSNAATDACQGATFTVTVTVSGASS